MSAGLRWSSIPLVLPLYLCIFIGVVNASLVIYTWNATAYAARSATRYAIVHGSTASYACTATDLKNIVYNSLPGLRKATVTTIWSPDNSPGSTINVNVKLSFATFVPFIKVPDAGFGEFVADDDYSVEMGCRAVSRCLDRTELRVDNSKVDFKSLIRAVIFVAGIGTAATSPASAAVLYLFTSPNLP